MVGGQSKLTFNFFYAAYFGQVQCVELLLKFSADVDSVDLNERTPLIAATTNGEIECVKILLDERASIDHSTTDGTTALMKAALHGHVVCVRLLLGLEADARKEDINFKTALAIAMEVKAEEVLRLETEQHTIKDMSAQRQTKSRSINMERRQKTESRLEKVIANYKTVIVDLGKRAEDIRNEQDNAELFIERFGPRKHPDPKYSN
jgi:ankyrin repeat protein